jgi:hypothetical protein
MPGHHLRLTAGARASPGHVGGPAASTHQPLWRHSSERGRAGAPRGAAVSAPRPAHPRPARVRASARPRASGGRWASRRSARPLQQVPPPPPPPPPPPLPRARLTRRLSAWCAAALFRILITPIDALKTTLQVKGAQGLAVLATRISNDGVLTLYSGALASSLATLMGHYPWFIVYNFLQAPPHMRPSHGRAPRSHLPAPSPVARPGRRRRPQDGAQRLHRLLRVLLLRRRVQRGAGGQDRQADRGPR